MTDTTPYPPKDYGGGDTWADDGDYYVPHNLREFYAVAEPTHDERVGYRDYGAHVTVPGVREVTRIVSAGTADKAPVVTIETEPIDTLAHIEGGSGYRTWLHINRLRKAEQAKRQTDRQAAREAQYLTCPCGTRDAGVRSAAVYGVGAKVSVVGCSLHLPLLVEVARAALLARAADQVLPDGRRVGEVAAAAVADAIADQLGPEDAR